MRLYWNLDGNKYLKTMDNFGKPLVYTLKRGEKETYHPVTAEVLYAAKINIVRMGQKVAEFKIKPLLYTIALAEYKGLLDNIFTKGLDRFLQCEKMGT